MTHPRTTLQLVVGVSSVLVATTAWASNQGGGAALLVLLLLFAVPVVLAALGAILALILTIKPLRVPATRTVRVMAWVVVALASLLLVSSAVGYVLLGGKGSAALPWALLVPALSIGLLIVGVARLVRTRLSSGVWLILRSVAWGLPLLVPLGIVVSAIGHQAGEAQLDRNLVQRLAGHSLGTHSLALVDGGRRIFAAGYGTNDGRHLQTWTQQDGRWTRDPPAFELPHKVEAAAVNVKHHRALVHTYKTMWLVDIDDLSSTRRLAELPGSLSSVAISRDGQLGAAGGNGEILVWSLPGGERVHELRPLNRRIDALIFGARGETIIAAGYERKIVVSGLSDGAVRCVLEGEGANASALFLSPDGSTLLSGARETVVRRWDLSTCSAAGVFSTLPASVTAFELSADGQRLALGDNHSRVHLAAYPAGGPATYLGRVYARDDPHGLSAVSSMAFHPDGQHLVAGAKCNFDSMAVFRLSE